MTTTQPKRQPIPFGKYLLLDRINIGGMAEVWRGKMFGAGGFERLVAIKRILPNIAEDDEFISMFIDEAKISVQLNHANVAKIEELGQIANNYFIAMEYIPGKDMRAIFDRGRKKSEPAPVPLVAYVVSKMCEGLDYAHRKKDGMGRDLNIVHRDISPQNILISFEGEVKVIDFGIAKAAGKATKTQAGILKGKFGYMSPEQIRGLPLDRRSDIFAIGVCLYEMLTGERLFVGDSDFSVLEKVRKAEVAPPSTYNRRIPDALEKIVLKALARDVDERYQYANELGDDLQRFLLTSDSIFSRKDLMQYMKSTFAEDVEREKQRLQEYSEIRAPEGMLAAIEMGFGGVPSSPMSGSTPAVQQNLPSVEAVVPNAAGARRSPTLAAMPKLTAAAPAASAPEEESGATQVVNNPDFEEPNTQPGMVGPGRTVTPVEVPRPPVLGEPPSQRTPPPRLSPVAPAPLSRPPVLAPTPPTTESTTVARQGRNTLDNLPRLVRSEPPVPDMPVASPPRLSASQPSVSRPSSPVVAPPPLLGEESTGEHDVAAESLPAAPPPPVRQPLPPRMSPSITDTSAPQTANRLPLLLGGGALLLMFLVVVGFLALRKPATGFIMVNLLTEVPGPVRVSLNAKDLDVPKTGPVFQEVKAGQAMVLVSAEGYKPFTRSVVVAEGTTPTQVDVKLVPEREVRPVRVVVVTQPPDAELKVDGKVVRQKGSSSTYLGEAPAGTEVVLEASAPGFKPVRKSFTPSATDTQLDEQLKLEPETFDVDVQSNPTGATILMEGKEMGTTPARLRLPLAARQLSLRMHCYDEASVTLAPAGGAAPAVNEKLNRRQHCK